LSNQKREAAKRRQSAFFGSHSAKQRGKGGDWATLIYEGWNAKKKQKKSDFGDVKREERLQ